MREEKGEREESLQAMEPKKRSEKQRAGDRMREKILQVARAEFLEYGFRDASLRRIAVKTSISVSNIYNHYKSKDDLFRAVLHPLLESFTEMLREHNSEKSMELYVEQTEEFQRAMIKEFLALMLRFRTELKLLLLGSGGSSLEGFKEEIIQQQSEVGVEYIHKLRTKYPKANRAISPLFIRICSHWWLIFMLELVANESLTKEDIEKALSEYVCFGTAGWKSLMGV